jgi:N-acetylated-alpha-linked acidic dipeptidase
LAYGIALAKTAGRIVLRLANAEVLPFEFGTWHTTVEGYLTEINVLTTNMREAVEQHNAFIDKKVFSLTADPTQPFKQPIKKAIVPYVDFSPLHNALAHLKVTVEALGEKSLVSLTSKGTLNDKLMHAEQVLTFASGLPRRGWYRAFTRDMALKRFQA